MNAIDRVLIVLSAAFGLLGLMMLLARLAFPEHRPELGRDARLMWVASAACLGGMLGRWML